MKGNNHTLKSLKIGQSVVFASNWKPLSSAKSLDALEKLMKQKMRLSSVMFEPTERNEWSVTTNQGLMDGMRVSYSNGKFNLETKA